MTNKEAIRILGRMLDEFCNKDSYAPECKDAVDMAIKELEKQIPNKAVGEYYARMRCPSCNHRIPSGLGSSSRRRDNWCNYCGQRIEWEDEG